jgi:hypothetical protein
MNAVRTSLPMLLALTLAPSVHAQTVCDPAGGFDTLNFADGTDGVVPIRGASDTAAVARGRPARGSLHRRAVFPVSDVRGPVFASLTAPDGRLSAAVWLREGADPLVIPGALVAATANGSLAVVRLVEGNDEIGRSAIDRVYRTSGELLGERRQAWNAEDSPSLQFSVEGDVLFERPRKGASMSTAVVLLDPASLQEIARVALDGEIISDALVIDRDTVFFTSRGGIFLWADGELSSIGESAPMRHESLEAHAKSRRVLSKGPGGFAVFGYDGARVSHRYSGTPVDSIGGFTVDGQLWEMTTGTTPFRTLDVVTHRVLAELEGDDPAKTGRERIACVFSDELVVAGLDGRRSRHVLSSKDEK